MKNLWIDEVKIKKIVETLSDELNHQYVGRDVNFEEWGAYCFQWLYGMSCHQRIRDAVLTRYTYIYELDEDNKVICLMLQKLPWFI